MADQNFYLKSGDLRPPIEATLLDADGVAVDLSTVTSVAFHMADDTNHVVVNASATIVNAAAGIVKYDWQAGDTDTKGVYIAEFEIIESGESLTFPNDKNILVHITEAVA